MGAPLCLHGEWLIPNEFGDNNGLGLGFCFLGEHKGGERERVSGESTRAGAGRGSAVQHASPTCPAQRQQRAPWSYLLACGVVSWGGEGRRAGWPVCLAWKWALKQAVPQKHVSSPSRPARKQSMHCMHASL